MNIYKTMPKATRKKWTRDEEEIINFFMELIPVLQEIKVDLEAKNLMDKEFLVPSPVRAYPTLQT